MTIEQAIRNRKSVRTFDGRDLSAEDLAQLKGALADAQNPWGIPLEFRWLDAGRDGVSSRVLVNAKTFVAGKYKVAPGAEQAFGYVLEKFELKAAELGIGTVFLAATIDRPAFEKAIDLAPGEVMPAVTPVGYPAKKRSTRESLMRKGVKSDSRLDFSQVFFRGDFQTPLSPEAAGDLRLPLEMVRLAPSATNKQPWRVVVTDGAVHFFEQKARGYVKPNTGDIQKVDMGICMAHFELTARELGVPGGWEFVEPGIQRGDGVDYIATWRLGA